MSAPSNPALRAPDGRAAALAGAISGTLAVAATYPLDLVRTRQALDRQLPPQSTWAALRSVFRTEGATALFRGLRPAVLSHAPACAIFFPIYKSGQSCVPATSTAGREAVAAGLAWCVTCAVMNPMWVVKTRFQAQSAGERVRRGSLRYGSVGKTLGLIYREQGVRGLYSGTLATMAAAPAAALQLPLYEAIKRYGDDTPSPTRIAIASASSSALVSVIGFPTEVVRVRLQAQEMSCQNSGGGASGTSPGHPKYSGATDAFRTIFRAEGIAGLYRGLSASLVRTVPNSAIGLLTFETLLQIFGGAFEGLDGGLSGEGGMGGGVDR